MQSKPDYWTEGYRAAMNGATYADNPHEGKAGATAWAFGCAQGMRDRNAAAFGRILAALQAGGAAA